jgi:hypothetical protein
LIILASFALFDSGLVLAIFFADFRIISVSESESVSICVSLGDSGCDLLIGASGRDRIRSLVSDTGSFVSIGSTLISVFGIKISLGSSISTGFGSSTGLITGNLGGIISGRAVKLCEIEPSWSDFDRFRSGSDLIGLSVLLFGLNISDGGLCRFLKISDFNFCNISVRSIEDLWPEDDDLFSDWGDRYFGRKSSVALRIASDNKGSFSGLKLGFSIWDVKGAACGIEGGREANELGNDGFGASGESISFDG